MDEKNKRYAYYSIVLPPVMSELEDRIYKEVEFKQAKIFDYTWEDIAFINTENGYMSINEIKQFLNIHHWKII